MNADTEAEHAAVHDNLLKFGVTRSTTKRQVMVVPYAGTFTSCLNYTREEIDDWHKEGNARIWSVDDEQIHITRLSRLIWDAISDTVVKAKEAMKWLTDIARVYSKWANENLPAGYERRMTWKTPDGFEVVHWRPEETKHRLSTYLDGRVDLVFYSLGDSLSSRDMATAIAPNFIHSMDASHLRQAVVAGKCLGLTHFAVIHDSFGTHAANMDVMLNQAIKPTFIKMYRGNLLKDFANSLPLPVQQEMPALPEQGTLDIEAISKSQFMFS